MTDRRQAGSGLLRRAARLPSAASGPPTPGSILGGLYVGGFFADAGVDLTGSEVNSWTGQVAGVVVPADGTPSYGADGVNYRGRSVVNMAFGETLRQPAIGFNLLAAGSKPYCFTLARIVNDATHNAIWQMRSNPANYTVGSLRKGTFGSGNPTLGGWDGTTVNSGVISNTSLHWWATGINAAGEAQIEVDGGAAVTGGSGLDLAGPVDAIFIGTDQFASLSTMSIAVHIICSAEPSAGQKAALRLWAQTDWGAP